jgi:hypothetical protein
MCQFRVKLQTPVLQKYFHRLKDQSTEISIFQPDNIKRRDFSADLGVDGRIILKWISNMLLESLLDESDSWEDSLAVSCRPNEDK